MFQTLAVTNFGVGLISQPLPAIRNLNPLMIIRNIDWKIKFHVDRIKCGQTSRLVVGTKIQTCHTEASQRYCLMLAHRFFVVIWFYIYSLYIASAGL